MQLGNYEAINPTDVPVISETAMPGSFVNLKRIPAQIKVPVCLDRAPWCIDRSNKIALTSVNEVSVPTSAPPSVDGINKRSRSYKPQNLKCPLT